MDMTEEQKDSRIFSRLSTLVHFSWVPLLWAVLCVAFYWDVLTAPASQIVAGNDLNNMFRIWLDYARERLSTGHLPLWNPYLNAGYAFIGDPQPALFYPPTWLSLLFPPTQGLGWSLVLHIWWAALGGSFWLRSITDQHGRHLSWAGVLSGAAVFAFSGFTFARIQAGHIGIITTGAWLPWTLWALNKLSTNLTWKVVGWGAACIGLALLAGHTATFIYLAIMLGAYTLMLTWLLPPDKRKRYLTMAVVMGCLGVAVAGVQLLPTLDLISASSRLGSADYAFASRFSWPVGYIITLLVPNFFGEPVLTGYWGDGIYDEMIYYVGILPLLLIWVAGRIHRDLQTRKHIIFWLGIAGVSLLTAFGSYGIVHRLLFRFVPLFNSMRAPARAGYLFTLSAAVVTAIAIHTLSHADKDQRDRLIKPVSTILVTVILVISSIMVIIAYGLFAWGRDSHPEAGRLWHMANAVAVFTLFFGLSTGWLRKWKRIKSGSRFAFAGLVIILLDLWTLGSGLVRVVPAPISSYWATVAQHIGSEPGRVLPWGLSIFEQNGALSHQVNSVFGYNPLEDAIYNRFITFYPDPRAHIYDLLNVTHVSTQTPLTLSDDDPLALVNEYSGIYVYERTTAMPHAWMATQVETANDDDVITLINKPEFNAWETSYVEPGEVCAQGTSSEVIYIVSDRPEIINARIQGEGGLVVFSERFNTNWHASLDNRAVPLVKANGLLQAVCVPPGEHTIQLRYVPTRLIWGAVLSGVSLIVILSMLFVHRKKPGPHIVPSSKVIECESSS